MEDKQKICDLLIPVLQETRDLHDLIELRYDKNYEIVKASYLNGAVKTANVAADSGTSMIRDILKQII